MDILKSWLDRDKNTEKEEYKARGIQLIGTSLMVYAGKLYEQVELKDEIKKLVELIGCTWDLRDTDTIVICVSDKHAFEINIVKN